MKIRVLDLAEANLLAGFITTNCSRPASVRIFWSRFTLTSSRSASMRVSIAGSLVFSACCPAGFPMRCIIGSTKMKSKSGGFWTVAGTRTGFVGS